MKRLLDNSYDFYIETPTSYVTCNLNAETLRFKGTNPNNNNNNNNHNNNNNNDYNFQLTDGNSYINSWVHNRHMGMSIIVSGVLNSFIPIENIELMQDIDDYFENGVIKPHKFSVDEHIDDPTNRLISNISRDPSHVGGRRTKHRKTMKHLKRFTRQRL